MTSTEQDAQPRYYRLILNALALAENPGATDAEREQANETARQLLTKHSIDMAEIASKREADSKPEEIKSEEFIFLGTLGEWHRGIAWSIVLTHGSARGVQSDRKIRVRDDVTGELVYTGSGSKRRVKTRHEFVLEVTAFETDLEAIKFLITSIRPQVTKGLDYYMKYTRPEQLSGYFLLNDDNGTRYRDRRQWLMSYADGLRENIRASKRKATEEVIDERAKTTGTETAVVRQSVSLALRSRTESVNDWMDNKYGGRLRASRGGNVAGGTGSASSSGFGSGMSANVSGAGSRAPLELGR